MMLFKNDIPCTKIEGPIFCGEEAETQAAKLYLGDTTLVCYNVYRRHTGMLYISQPMDEVANKKVFIGGVFNAHHHRLESSNPCSTVGIHIIQTLDEMPCVRLPNNGEPSHRDGGRLDLSFITEELHGAATWEVHSMLTSDHFVVQTSLTLSKMPPPPPPPTTAEKMESLKSALAQIQMCNQRMADAISTSKRHRPARKGSCRSSTKHCRCIHTCRSPNKSPAQGQLVLLSRNKRIKHIS